MPTIDGGKARVKALEAMWRSLWKPFAKFFAPNLGDRDPEVVRQALRGEIDRRSKAGSIPGLADADARAEVRWLHEHRVLERRLHLAADFVQTHLRVAPAGHHVWHHGKPRLLQQPLHDHLGTEVIQFQQHVVLAGAVKTDAVKKRVEQVVGADKRIRSLRNELLVAWEIAQ